MCPSTAVVVLWAATAVEAGLRPLGKMQLGAAAARLEANPAGVAEGGSDWCPEPDRRMPGGPLASTGECRARTEGSTQSGLVRLWEGSCSVARGTRGSAEGRAC